MEALRYCCFFLWVKISTPTRKKVTHRVQDIYETSAQKVTKFTGLLPKVTKSVSSCWRERFSSVERSECWAESSKDLAVLSHHPQWGGFFFDVDVFESSEHL